jgi:hypothetical protein
MKGKSFTWQDVITVGSFVLIAGIGVKVLMPSKNNNGNSNNGHGRGNGRGGQMSQEQYAHMMHARQAHMQRQAQMQAMAPQGAIPYNGPAPRPYVAPPPGPEGARMAGSQYSSPQMAGNTIGRQVIPQQYDDEQGQRDSIMQTNRIRMAGSA